MIHANCTLFWHLPTRIARCTMKSDRGSHTQATRRQRGRAVPPGGYQQKTACHRRPALGDRESSAAETWLREGGEALPFPLARKDRIRFQCAEACGPWLYIHGSNRNDLGSAPPSAARYPRHAAGPVLQHRPSEALPRLTSEREGLAM